MAKALSKVRFYMDSNIGDGSLTSFAAFDAETTYVKVGNVISTGGPNTTKPQVEHTDFDSSGREYFGDLPEQGDFTIEANENFGDAGQNQVFGDASTPGIQRACKVEKLNAADNTVLQTTYFYGEVVGAPEAANQGEVYKANYTIRITGAIFRA